MTTYEISPTSAGVAIDIAGVGEQQEQLLTAFGECQQGRCSCPTDEYRKVESMDVVSGDDRISIQLSAKEGTAFDISQIGTCLDHTVRETSEVANDQHQHEC